jgi:hypothetical protein
MNGTLNIDSALALFEESAIIHAEATEQGNYKLANKSYAKIIEAINFLKSNHALMHLYDFLNHSSVGVRMWSATYLLPEKENDSIKTLKAIVNGGGIHSLTAETTISEWRKGNLKL